MTTFRLLRNSADGDWLPRRSYENMNFNSSSCFQLQNGSPNTFHTRTIQNHTKHSSFPEFLERTARAVLLSGGVSEPALTGMLLLEQFGGITAADSSSPSPLVWGGELTAYCTGNQTTGSPGGPPGIKPPDHTVVPLASPRTSHSGRSHQDWLLCGSGSVHPGRPGFRTRVFKLWVPSFRTAL